MGEGTRQTIDGSELPVATNSGVTAEGEVEDNDAVGHDQCCHTHDEN